jgi:hypothetical protein
MIFTLAAEKSFSQDSTRKAQDTIRKVQDTLTVKSPLFILSDYKYSYVNQTNPDTLTRKRFLWYPAKNFEDIFNYLPGYYLNYMDVGQLNPVDFNQTDPYFTAVLRNGRPINEPYNGAIDFNLFSRNEIEAIEVTNGFANFTYTYLNAVNIIQRQVFQNRPLTEISFINDRYENLYFDGNFHQNLFRNFNLNFGITKHSYDGKYRNSDFDKWLGRFNMNFSASPKLNFFAYFNYAKIQKGLNEGIDFDSININNKDTMFDPQLAAVVNSDSYEKKERFDIDIGAVFLIGKSSYTRLQLYETNSFRQYRDEENRLNPNGYFMTKNNHSINYGIKLQQIFRLKLFKKLDVISRSEGVFDYISGHNIYNYPDTNLRYHSVKREHRLFSEVNVNFKGLKLTGYLKWWTFNDFKTISYTPGIKGEFDFNLDSLNALEIYGQYVHSQDFITGGIKFTRGNNMVSASYYQLKHINQINNVLNISDALYEYVLVRGINITANIRLFKFDINVNYSANLKTDSNTYINSPKQFGNVSLSFHDVAIKNKLEYKIGFVSRAWSSYKANFYSGVYNFLYGNYPASYADLNIISNATLDFFVMGKIGRATFGLTLENILDRVIYNTGVYPNIDRGGLANVISRFNITWSFFD